MTLPTRVKYQGALTEFMRAFGASLDTRLWVKLVEEEAGEVEEAALEGASAHYLKEVADLMYVAVGYDLVCSTLFLMPEDEMEKTNRMFLHVASLLVEARQVFSKKVIDEAFLRVHRSNMSKLGDDGKPIRRDDGKILKGPNYKAPDLADLV